MLKTYGTGVFFINDNINTLETDGELRLTIMASLAQDESRRTSERVKWGINQKMKNGFVYGQSLLGYDIIKGKLHVNNDEKEVVKCIFEMYAYEGWTAQGIARELTREGVLPVKRMKNWSGTCILRILRNEKYVGDLITHKYYIEEYLTHKLVKNIGIEIPSFTVNQDNQNVEIIDKTKTSEITYNGTEEVQIITAVFNENDILIDSYFGAEIPALSESSQYIKIFAWDKISDMRPIC